MRKEFTRAITGALSIGLILGIFPTQMYASEQISINQEEKEASIEHATVLVSPDPRYTTVFNNGDYNYKILSQEDKTVEINRYLPGEQSGNEISIPEQVEYDGAIYTVTSIGISAFYGYSELTGELVIPNTVTNIGENAFKRCTGLTGDLIIPDSVINIGVGAFGECTGFNGKISIPNSVINIGLAAFCGCSGLIGDLVIPDSVTDIGYQAFMGCTGLNGKLVISNNLEKIESNVFRDCSGLTGDLIIPDSVTTIGNYAFDKCSQLTGELIIPSGVTSIGLTAFGECLGFAGNLIIPESVIYIGDNAFIFCENIKSITIPFNLSNIEGKPFAGCDNVDIVKLNYGQSNINNQEYNEWKTFITDKMGLNEEKIESGYIFNTTETKQVKGPGIEIPDTEAPVFNYTGESTITIKNGSEFTLPKVTASDNKDESVAVTCVIRDSSDEIIPAIDTKITGTYTITYSAADEAGNEATPLVITVVVKGEIAAVQFKDDTFKRVLIENGVDKDNDGEITVEEMEQVIQLNIIGKQIKDISGIEYAVNLQWLNMSDNPISDLTPLSNLNKLGKLEMQSCKLSNLEAIKSLTNLRSLGVSDNPIGDITVIQALTNLDTLYMYGCGITNIELLSNLKNLKDISLGGNNLVDLSPLATLSKLQALKLFNCSIKDISSLAQIKSLTHLQLGSNQIMDITPLKELSSLTYLNLRNNSLVDIESLSELANIVELDLGYNLIKDISSLVGKEYSKLKLDYNYLDINSDSDTMQVIKQIESISDNVIYTPQKIQFKDDALKRVLIENGVDKDKDGEITIEEMKQVTRLDISRGQIKDISGIEYAVNLEWFNMSDNSVSDLTPLSNLNKLRELEMSGCKISSLQAIKSLTNLEALVVSGNTIVDITDIQGLINLESLYMYECGITNIEVLSDLKNLQDISLGGNNLMDLSPLATLPKLQALKLFNCNIKEISFLTQLKSLTNLQLGLNQITDITPLKGLSSLTYLNLRNNSLVDIEPISELANIVELDLSYNLIKDISSLDGKEYRELNLEYNYLDINNDSDTMQIIKQIESTGGDVTYTPQKQAISSNANLSSLKTNQGSLSPVFNKETIAYTMTVENEVKNIVIEGMVEDETASVEGLGEKILSVGDNTIKIVATAADKTTKTYTIIITRKAAVNTEPSSGGGGGASPKLPTVEEVLEKLQDKEVIVNNFKEQMPYTSLNAVLTLEQIKKLINNKLTDKQLQEIVDKPELLNKLGIEPSMLSSQVILKPLENPVFTDISQSHWANSSIKLAAELGLVVGLPNGTFEPKASLQVADTFTFLDRVLLLNGITDMKLSRDIVEKYVTNKDDWAFANIASVASKLSESTLKTISELGNRPIQRELLAHVLYEITEGKLEFSRDEILFEDIEESSYKEAISYCVRVGLLNGMDNKHMQPEKELTRAELMSVLIRLNELLK